MRSPERYRLIIPDMPGYASSDLPPPDDIVVDLSQNAFVTTSIPSLGQTKTTISWASRLAAFMLDRWRQSIKTDQTVVPIGTGGMGVNEAPHTRREMQRLSRDMDYETRAAIHHNNLCGVCSCDRRRYDLAILLQDEFTRPHPHSCPRRTRERCVVPRVSGD